MRDDQLAQPCTGNVGVANFVGGLRVVVHGDLTEILTQNKTVKLSTKVCISLTLLRTKVGFKLGTFRSYLTRFAI